MWATRGKGSSFIREIRHAFSLQQDSSLYIIDGLFVMVSVSHLIRRYMTEKLSNTHLHSAALSVSAVTQRNDPESSHQRGRPTLTPPLTTEKERLTP